MKEYYQQFLSYLEAQDKEKCVTYALDLVSQQKVEVVALYEQILQPALNGIGCQINEKNLCIWQEHVRSSIVRTIIECCYPFVLRDKQQIAPIGQRVIVICPDGEYHDIGARMVADFFTLCGFETVFVGASTPKTEFLLSLHDGIPQYIAMSVTNSYNLFAAAMTITEVKKIHPTIKFIVGGTAFASDVQSYQKIGADLLINTYDDLFKIARGEN